MRIFIIFLPLQLNAQQPQGNDVYHLQLLSFVLCLVIVV